MKIFKFGGASVKDADGVKNLLNVVNKKADKNTIIVVSAMGKTTNLLEKIVNSFINKEEQLFQENIEVCRQFHFSILEELFDDRTNDIYSSISKIFVLLSSQETEHLGI